ncbi:MAG: ABC transporter ATP-binding protein [Syntrophaceae bacterium]|nr:ABC transporter ATP-binding protein [Syntrophaceae bacterium]
MMAVSREKSPPIVEVKNVTMRFGPVEAVKDISLNVVRGDVMGLVGPDGAGKSTLLRLIATMMKPSSGEIFIDHLNVVAEKQKIKNIIGYMPQRFGLYQDLTVDENMQFFMDVFDVPRAQRKSRKDKYLGFSNLLPFTNRLAGNLSGGMKQKLGLACVLVHEPQVLILDEPTNGVDPVSRSEFWDILGHMQKEGMTIIVSTAYLDEGEKCDMLGLMHKSILLEAAPPAVVRGDHKNLEEAMIERIKIADGELDHVAFQL